MSVFLTSDLLLNNASAAQEQKLSTQEYNNMIINNWNQVVAQKDKVILLGDIGSRNMKEIKKILNTLNGYKFLADYDSNTSHSRDLWKWAGISQVWDIELHYDEFFNNTFNKIWITNKIQPNSNENEYFLVGNKISKISDYEKRVINISMSNWDFTPLEMNNTIKMIKDYYYTEKEELWELKF